MDSTEYRGKQVLDNFDHFYIHSKVQQVCVCVCVFHSHLT